MSVVLAGTFLQVESAAAGPYWQLSVSAHAYSLGSVPESGDLSEYGAASDHQGVGFDHDRPQRWSRRCGDMLAMGWDSSCSSVLLILLT